MTAATLGGGKPPRIFFSVGEPSGDLHGSNLIRALHQADASVVCEGFGGDRMRSAGCRLLYPLCDLSVVGFLRVAQNIRTFFGLLNLATDHLRETRPDAVVLIDYPGFNWWMARRAHGQGIPVYYFVPPQIWAWASWRVAKMRRYVDHVLCTVPFEQPWYRARGIEADYIGHPYFDALHAQQLDETFVAGQRSRSGTIIGLLPGSRRQEVEYNLATQIRAAARIRERKPDCRFLVACFKEEHARRAATMLATMFPEGGRCEEGDLVSGYRGAWSLPIELCVGRTPEIIHLAHSCVAVSGSVSLELLHACKPAVIVYRASAPLILSYHIVRNVKHVSLVNLLADRVLYPEYVSSRCKAEAVAGNVLRWLEDDGEYRRLTGGLSELRDRVARPGACERAARSILNLSAIGRGRRVA